MLIQNMLCSKFTRESALRPHFANVGEAGRGARRRGGGAGGGVVRAADPQAHLWQGRRQVVGVRVELLKTGAPLRVVVSIAQNATSAPYPTVARAPTYLRHLQYSKGP